MPFKSLEHPATAKDKGPPECTHCCSSSVMNHSRTIHIYTPFPLAVANQNQSGSSTLNQTSNSLFLKKKKKQQLCTQPLTLLSQSFIQQFRFHTPKLCQGEFTALPPKDLSSFNAWASSAKILKTRMLPNVRKNLSYSVLQLRSGTCVTSAPEKLF